jgi:hypothetical protein
MGLVVGLVFGLAYGQAIQDIAWGFASSAQQVEGAWNVDGRSIVKTNKGPSVWDTWFRAPKQLVKSPNVHEIAIGDPLITTETRCENHG